MGLKNFDKIRQWVANLVDSFDVSPDKTRVAVVRYSDRPTIEFNLSRYRTLEDVKRAARNIRYLGGNTMTGEAISYTTSNIFIERNGARPQAKGVQRVAILLTDGRSQDYVLEPSQAAAKAGIRMFAVGIGEALKEELEEIAATPKNAHVFHVTDFNAIDKIRGRLRRRLCESKSVVCLHDFTLKPPLPSMPRPQRASNLTALILTFNQRKDPDHKPLPDHSQHTALPCPLFVEDQAWTGGLVNDSFLNKTYLW